MDGVLAQQGTTGLAAPASRQDVVSALLSAYGNSFGHATGSPSSFSPVAADKELPPPPPPRMDSLRKKPLPAVQRAEQRMSTKFQLRVDEEAARSPNSTSPRRKILYRSLSREAKPPSLTLKISNGSTATVPPTPALTLRSQRSPAVPNLEEKSLPSPPPPPPVKSDRRPTAQPPTVSAQKSEPKTPLARNDSLLSQGETKPTESDSAPKTDMASVVKRKALPLPAVRKFRSLAELGAGPRGGKGGPMPPTSAPRKNSTEDRASKESRKDTRQSRLEERTSQTTDQQRDPLTINRLPPTPEDEKFSTVSVPAPPRKAFVGMGLPSNPRAKGGPISPKHVRGKSSTGFNVLKAQRPAPPPPNSKLETITPEMTPVPKLKPNDESKMDIISPVSPLPPPSEQRRPFSFEAVQRPEPAAQPEPQTAKSAGPTTAAMTIPPTSSPAVQLKQPERPTSLDLLDSSPGFQPLSVASPVPTPAPVQAATEPSVQEASPIPAPAVLAPAPAPALTTALSPSIPAPQIPNLPPSPIDEPQSTPPPFTPLTRQPVPMPTTLIPAITPSQLTCYTKHSTSIWSNNTFQPMGCMICLSNDKDRKWTCTWCRLRICRNCSEELCMVPGRDLGRLLEVRKNMEKNDSDGANDVVNRGGAGEMEKKGMMPGILVSVVEEVEI